MADRDTPPWLTQEHLASLALLYREAALRYIMTGEADAALG